MLQLPALLDQRLVLAAFNLPILDLPGQLYVAYATLTCPASRPARCAQLPAGVAENFHPARATAPVR
jgi:hypothetical protein